MDKDPLVDPWVEVVEVEEEGMEVEVPQVEVPQEEEEKEEEGRRSLLGIVGFRRGMCHGMTKISAYTS